MNPDGSVWISQGGGGFVMAGDDAIWAIFQRHGVRDVVRIDPLTNETEAIIADLPVLPNPISALGANGYVWLASWDTSSVKQYDLETGEEIVELPVGSHPVESILAYGDVWTTAIHGNVVSRIDTETADVQRIEMDPPGNPITMQVIRDDLAIVGNAGAQPYLIDPEQMEVIGQVDLELGADCVATYPGEARVAAVDGVLWVDRCQDDELVILDPETSETLGTVASPVTADPPFYSDDLMWMPLRTETSVNQMRTWLALDRETHEVVAEYEAVSSFTDGYYVLGFDSIWMFGHEGILRIPADTLSAAAR